ncbi:MAG: NAD(P)/FAD-dependent oxidoreductase [Acidimicrobiales bacterium]
MERAAVGGGEGDGPMADAVADVVVVGSGLVGAATAYELAVGGASVVVVDAGHPGRATDAGAGILSPETSPHPDDDWYALAVASADHHRSLRRRLAGEGVVDTGHSDCPVMTVAVREGDDEWFEQRRALAARRAPSVVTEIDVAEAGERFPALAPVRRALWSTTAARLDGRRLRAVLLERAAARGAELRAGEVHRLDGAGGRCTAVVAGDDRLACGAVVLAGGAWSPALAGGDAVLPVRPMKGQILHLALAPDTGWDTGAWPIVQPVLGFYYVPWPGGRVACGATFESVGHDARPTAQGLRDLLRECLAVAPGLGGATVVDVRVGLRPMSADDRPFLGPLPGWGNVGVATGHGADGLLLGPYSGLLVARWLLDGRVPDEIAAFTPTRPAL